MFKKNDLDISYTKTYSYGYDNIKFFDILISKIQRSVTNEIRILIQGMSISCIWFSLLTYRKHNKELDWEPTRNSIRFSIHELYRLNDIVKKAIKEFAKIYEEPINEPIVIEIIETKSENEKIQILINKHKNKLCLDFRIYITIDKGLTWKPTKDGVSFCPNELYDLQSAIEKAIIIYKKESNSQNITNFKFFIKKIPILEKFLKI